MKRETMKKLMRETFFMLKAHYDRTGNYSLADDGETCRYYDEGTKNRCFVGKLVPRAVAKEIQRIYSQAGIHVDEVYDFFKGNCFKKYKELPQRFLELGQDWHDQKAQGFSALDYKRQILEFIDHY